MGSKEIFYLNGFLNYYFVFKIRAIQMNEPLPPSNIINLSSSFNKNGLNQSSNSKESSLSEADNSKNECLNNLVGGATTNLLDYKFGSKIQPFTPPVKAHHNLNYFYQQQQSEQLSSSKLNLSNLKTINEVNNNNNNCNISIEHDDLQLIDMTQDRKELESEFEQVRFLCFGFERNLCCRL